MSEHPSNVRPTRIHNTWRTNVLFIGLSAVTIASLTGLLHWRAEAAAMR